MTVSASDVGSVLIGRNEGDRLVRALYAVRVQNLYPIIYVDSGSTDGSVQAAEDAGATIVVLQTDQPFTAARARNAGFAALMAHQKPPTFVQFIDGDCELRAGWVAAGLAHLGADPDVAAVCGRRQERAPDASLYNRLIDLEWDTPVGQARSCGGDVLMRTAALEAVGGYRAQMIAGEEPELCVRLRQSGWKIWRLDQDMTWHDADIMRFSQWWQRARRAGHAYAEGAALHGAPPERHNVAQTLRALIWGMGLPLAIILGCFVTPWALVLALLWPLKVMRLSSKGYDLAHVIFLTLGNVPEAVGILGYWRKRLTGGTARIIEYK
jgi:GT2 family glycosyltransferase